MLMACRAAASVSGLAAEETYASMACVRASMPVAAVRRGGMPFMRTGSLMAICGVTRQSRMAILTLRRVSVMMQKRVISEAVPAVVLMAISGTILFLEMSMPS